MKCFLKRESIGDFLIQADVANHLAVFTMDWGDRQIYDTTGAIDHDFHDSCESLFSF
jgi:hypothetical protein